MTLQALHNLLIHNAGTERHTIAKYKVIFFFQKKEKVFALNFLILK